MGVMTFAAAQLLRVLPRNAISRAMGALCEAQVPAPLMNGIVRAYTRAYRVDLDEACPSNLPYTSFDAFFTRKLREGARAALRQFSRCFLALANYSTNLACASRYSTCRRSGWPAGRPEYTSSPNAVITVSRLLKSCATLLASLPTASRRCD